ncbi:hypothetical protein CD110_11775 [Staphylococcus casei]|nr:hypothetical protein CD110_11775 [Staphylococcus casei]
MIAAFYFFNLGGYYDTPLGWSLVTGQNLVALLSQWIEGQKTRKIVLGVGLRAIQLVFLSFLCIFLSKM